MLFEVSTIRVPPVLRPEVGGARQLEVEAATVADALGELVERFPSLRSRVYDDGAVPPFMNVFVDGEDIRVLEGLDTPVTPDATILLLPAVAGG